MRLSTLMIAAVGAVAVIALVLLIAGVNFERPTTVQGAALYNPADEIVVKGVVRQIQEFPCPVGEGEMGVHLTIETADSVTQVHLAPGRILRSQKINFAPGDQIAVLGSKFRFRGNTDIIAREISRGNENFVFRDREGKLMLVQ